MGDGGLGDRWIDAHQCSAARAANDPEAASAGRSQRRAGRVATCELIITRSRRECAGTARGSCAANGGPAPGGLGWAGQPARARARGASRWGGRPRRRAAVRYVTATYAVRRDRLARRAAAIERGCRALARVARRIRIFVLGPRAGRRTDRRTDAIGCAACGEGQRAPRAPSWARVRSRPRGAGFFSVGNPASRSGGGGGGGAQLRRRPRVRACAQTFRPRHQDLGARCDRPNERPCACACAPRRDWLGALAGRRRMAHVARAGTDPPAVREPAASPSPAPARSRPRSSG